MIWEIHRLFSVQRDADKGSVAVWTGCTGKKGTCALDSLCLTVTHESIQLPLQSQEERDYPEKPSGRLSVTQKAGTDL